MSQLLDLQVEIAARPPEASPETAASITLRCETLKLIQEEGMFSYPLTKKEREDLRWYLEEYWKWPFEGFAQRGSTVEQLLPMLGQRLYQAAFGQGAARDIMQQWRADTTGAHQISIITTDARSLSLPWELLHDGQDFLVLQANPPISIVRRIAEEQQPLPLVTTFEKPLRVLLVTARPVDKGQVDARIIAREVLDVMQDQIEAGAIELEFLRPPTFEELITRLSDTDRPVHVLHFDGHGVFYQFPGSQDGNDEERGRLFFEKDDGKGDPVDAASLAEMLRYAGVQIVVLNACQSATIGEKDIFSSVAVQLLQGGVQAVVAMSASVMTTSAALYVKAFYGALAAASSVQAAHEQAQQALHEHPERNPLQRRLDEAGKAVNLQDWWLPYLYLQRSLALQPVKEEPESQRSFSTPTAQLPSSTLSASSTYQFTGRSAELLQIERSLLRKRIVVVSGFGGIGKTALAREVADWLTRTKMYDSTCFVSFEQGGDAPVFLSVLGNVLAINDGSYHPYDPPAALAILAPLLKKQHVLIIADNVESILPGGNVPLDDVGRDQLWETLARLRSNGAGVLITSRNAKLDDQRFAPGTQTDYQEVKGLLPDDAYTLAVQVMNVNHIDLANVPYVDLRDLLVQLDHLPLAIRLVLPVLQSRSLAKVQADFASLLPTFQDDEATGRNRSLLASLDYSWQQMSEEQQALLTRLAPFEGGANEKMLLTITEIPENRWGNLKPTLEQTALVIAEPMHDAIPVPFLHFHPVLMPFLRGQSGTDDAALRERYAQSYFDLANRLFVEDIRNTRAARVLIRQELPNLRHALELLLEAGKLEDAANMANSITKFLNYFGLWRERDKIRQQIAEAVASAGTQADERLTLEEYLRENDLGEDEMEKGDLCSAYIRFTSLLERIEVQPEGTQLGRDSYSHCLTLGWLARCLRKEGKIPEAEERLHDALAIIDALISQQPDDQGFLHQRAVLQSELGDVLRDRGQYQQAREAYEEGLRLAKQQGYLRQQSIALEQLGRLEFQRADYVQSRSYYTEALKSIREWDEPAREAVVWHELGMIAYVLALGWHQMGQTKQEQEDLIEAERCYRKALELAELHGDLAGAAKTCNQLAFVAELAGRYDEAEVWYKRVLKLDEKVDPGKLSKATHLNNFADLLVNKVQKKVAPTARLVEARRYAEEALALLEKVSTTAEIWSPLGILANIADLEGRSEEARNLRRREHEAYANYPGYRVQMKQALEQVKQAFEQAKSPLGQYVDVDVIAAAVKGDEQMRTNVEAALKQLEGVGLNITNAIRRIWAGERDWHSLTEELNAPGALIVLMVLEAVQ